MTEENQEQETDATLNTYFKNEEEMTEEEKKVDLENFRKAMESLKRQLQADGINDELDHGYFNKAGKPITYVNWLELFPQMEYRRIGSDHLENGLWISTVWDGISRDFFKNVPRSIFESAVFIMPDFIVMEMLRYDTLEEAETEHNKLVEFYQDLSKETVDQLRETHIKELREENEKWEKEEEKHRLEDIEKNSENSEDGTK